jgi:hypothetical protein
VLLALAACGGKRTEDASTATGAAAKKEQDRKEGTSGR